MRRLKLVRSLAEFRKGGSYQGPDDEDLDESTNDDSWFDDHATYGTED